MSDNEGKTKTGLLGNYLPKRTSGFGRPCGICVECKAVKYVSRMYRENGEKAKISDAGPFFCSRRCTYAHRKRKEVPDWVRK